MTRIPIWRSIADTLTSEIARGLYAPGARLPSEAQLAGRFGVNRHTVRHALSDLADRGVTWSRRGAGVFVAAPPPTEYPIGQRVRFHAQIAAAGRLPSKRLLSLVTRRADPQEREALDLPASALVHVYDGLSLADDLPLAVFRSVFPEAFLPDLPQHLEATGSVTAALAACGIDDFTRKVTRMTARAADQTEARHLRLPDGAPVLQTVGINVDGQGRAVELGRTVFAGERVTVTVGEAGPQPS